jgi:hypothetical protein
VHKGKGVKPAELGSINLPQIGREDAQFVAVFGHGAAGGFYRRRRGDESQTFAFEIQSETPHVVSYILARHGLFQPAWLFYRLIKVAEEIRVEPCRH